MRKIKLLNVVFIMGLISLSSTCQKIGRKVILLNNISSDTLYPLVAWAGMEHIYPDTLLPKDTFSSPRFTSPGIKRVIAETGMGGNWNEIFSNLPSDTLSIYLFSADTLKVYRWFYIRDEYKVLKRYDLSLDDLKKLNWTITYPPSVEMRDMKQFPPY